MKISTSVKYFLRLSILSIIIFNVINAQVPDSIRVEPGWNLISLPLSINDSTKSSLFPTATSDAFIYQNSYISKDTLGNGYGFWLKFDSAQSFNVMGDILFDDTILVHEGWNMIGSIMMPTPVSMIKTDPPGIIISNAFGYSPISGYQSSDTLQPGHGYWIKVSQNGTVILTWKGVILNDSTREPEKYPNFVSVSLDSNHLILTYVSENDLPTFEPGYMLVGNSAGGYARRVISTTTNGNQLIVQTEIVSFSDVFDIANIDTSFQLIFPDLRKLQKLLGTPLRIQGKTSGMSYSIKSSTPLLKLNPSGSLLNIEFPNLSMTWHYENKTISLKADKLSFWFEGKIEKWKFCPQSSNLWRWAFAKWTAIFQFNHYSKFDNLHLEVDGKINNIEHLPLFYPPITMERLSTSASGYVITPIFTLNTYIQPSKEMKADLGCGTIEMFCDEKISVDNNDWGDYESDVIGTADAGLVPIGSFDGELKVFLEPKIDILINGKIGMSVAAEPYLYNNISNPPLDAEIGAGDTAKLLMDLNMVYDKLEDGTDFVEFAISGRRWPWFATHGPTYPSNPNPPHLAENVVISPTLRWTCSDVDGDPITYDVYFGKDNPPATIVSPNQTGTSLVRNDLSADTRYYWRVKAKDSHNNTTLGPIWRFTTAPTGGGLPCVMSLPTVSYASKTYHTVRIGDQCWLKENLDVGTMIYGSLSQADNGIIEKYCYDNDPSYCNSYGGLYQWDEAMNYTTTAGWRGICPGEWHIPTYTEISTLSFAVGDDGNALKAIGQGTGGGVGTNTSGFSALLAGARTDYGIHMFFGYYGFIWTSNRRNEDSVYNMWLNTVNSSIYQSSYNKTDGYSVRCLKNTREPSSNPDPDNGATAVSTSPTLIWPHLNTDYVNPTYDVYFGTNNPPDTLVSYNQTDTSLARSGLSGGTTYYWIVVAKDGYGDSTSGPVWSFTTQSGGGSPCLGDSTVLYAGTIYHTVPIGSQCWLKENLNVGTMVDSLQNQTDNSTIEKYCYGNYAANCTTYGGFYQWDEAMQYVTTEGAQGICPPGWHVPIKAELDTLKALVSNDGNSLKAIGQGSGAGAGTDTSGFSALLSGYRFSTGKFYSLGEDTFLHSSTEYDATRAYYLALNWYESNIAINSNGYKVIGYSVRCIKD